MNTKDLFSQTFWDTFIGYYLSVSENLQQMILKGTMSSSTKNLSNQGSLKNNFLKEISKNL